MTHVLPTVRNGVDSAQMYGTLDAIKDRARSSGSSSSARRTPGSTAPTTARSIQYFYGAGQEDRSRLQAFTVDAGEPGILLGADTGPNPAELLLSALAACLTTTLVYIGDRAQGRCSPRSPRRSPATWTCAARSASPTRSATASARSACTSISRATRSDEKLQEIVERAQARSVVYDIVTNGVPVEITPSFANPSPGATHDR